MSQPTVTVVTPAPDDAPTDQGSPVADASFAAGVAAATAAQAAEEAEEAEQTAEAAQETAAVALDVAADASEQAWATTMELEDLRARVAALEAGPAVAEEVADVVEDLAPEPTEDKPAPAATEDKPKTKRAAWFG